MLTDNLHTIQLWWVQVCAIEGIFFFPNFKYHTVAIKYHSVYELIHGNRRTRHLYIEFIPRNMSQVTKEWLFCRLVLLSIGSTDSKTSNKTDAPPLSYPYAYPDSKVHKANMGPTWVLSAPDGPHVGPMNLAIRVCFMLCCGQVMIDYTLILQGYSNGTGASYNCPSAINTLRQRQYLPPFHRQHFKMRFLENIYINFDKDFTEVYSQGSN